jgi:hypothetical protein
MTDAHRLSIFRAALCLLLVGASAPALAEVDQADPIRYALGNGSTYQKGCLGPCACPVIESGVLHGSFILTYVTSDPLYNWYDVSDVEWVASLNGGTQRKIKGSGTYRVGGEVAVMHELSLDLAIDGDPSVHFSSGLVSGGGSFPAIDVTITIPDQGCFNTEMHVVAKPTTHVSMSRDAVSWQELPLVAGYDVVVGSLNALRLTHGNFKQATLACVADEGSGGEVGYTSSPGPGQGLWFLARPDVGSWDAGSPAQVGSCDAEIDASSAGCP